jgi:hypothetical protein
LKKIAIPLCALTISISPIKSHAMFGMDAAAMIPYLIEIINQSIRQYNQMKIIYDNAKHHKDMFMSINDGLNEAIGLLESLPIEDENILGKLRSFRRAVREVERLYGTVPRGQEEQLLRLHDETVAESIKISNSLKEYAKNQEDNSNRVALNAGRMSPKGAARVNLETNAAILHTLNQLLKVNGQMLKLQSETLAMSNKTAKESNLHFQKVTGDLGSSFKGFEANFRTPRF